MGHMRSCKFVFILSSLSSNSFSNELFHVQSTNCVPFRSRESEACSHGLQNRSRWVIVIACFSLLFSLVLFLVALLLNLFSYSVCVCVLKKIDDVEFNFNYLNLICVYGLELWECRTDIFPSVCGADFFLIIKGKYICLVLNEARVWK